MAHTHPHVLQLAETHASGAEEWLCPQCGRRLLIRWASPRQRAILAVGDPAAAHIGGARGHAPRQILPPFDATLPDLQFDGASYEPEELGLIPYTDLLRPWLGWMGVNDFFDQPDQSDRPDRPDQMV